MVKKELAQLEARKKELEASGLKGPIVTPSVLGLSQDGASTETRAPKRKIKINKRDTLAFPHKRDRSTISCT